MWDWWGSGQLYRIERALIRIERKVDVMAGELATLQTEVAEIKTVVDSAIMLPHGLKQALDDAIATGDPAALAALEAELDAKANEPAAAVAAIPHHHRRRRNDVVTPHRAGRFVRR